MADLFLTLQLYNISVCFITQPEFFASGYHDIPTVTMVIRYIPLDLPHHSTLIIPHSGIDTIHIHVYHIIVY